MDQSTFIVGTVIAGFIVFVTVKGELPRYMGFLIGTPNQAAPASTTPYTNAAGAINPTSAGGNAASFPNPFNSSPSSPGGSSMASTAMTALEIAGALV